jgi:hypothetical protein
MRVIENETVKVCATGRVARVIDADYTSGVPGIVTVRYLDDHKLDDVAEWDLTKPEPWEA